MEIKTLHLWRIKHSYLWMENGRSGPKDMRLDNLVTMIATGASEPSAAIKIAEHEASRHCKRIDIHKVERMGFVEVPLTLG